MPFSPNAPDQPSKRKQKKEAAAQKKEAVAQNKQHSDALPFAPEQESSKPKSSAGAFKEPPNTPFDKNSVKNLQIPAFKPKSPAGAFEEPPNTPFDKNSVKNLQIPAFKPKSPAGAFKEPPNTPFDKNSVKNLQIPAFKPKAKRSTEAPFRRRELSERGLFGERVVFAREVY